MKARFALFLVGFVLLIIALRVWTTRDLSITCEDFTLFADQNGIRPNCINGDISAALQMQNPQQWQLVVGRKPEHYPNQVEISVPSGDGYIALTLANMSCSLQQNGVLISYSQGEVESVFAFVGPNSDMQICDKIVFDLENRRMSMPNQWELSLP